MISELCTNYDVIRLIMIVLMIIVIILIFFFIVMRQIYLYCEEVDIKVELMKKQGAIDDSSLFNRKKQGGTKKWQ